MENNNTEFKFNTIKEAVEDIKNATEGTLIIEGDIPEMSI